MISSSSSFFSNDFICSPFYKAESANSYLLNNNRELANQLDAAYFGPSCFSSLPAENSTELVAPTSANIVKLDSNAGPSFLPTKHKRSYHSHKWAIVSVPVDEWDSNNMIGVMSTMMVTTDTFVPIYLQGFLQSGMKTRHI